MKRFLKLTCCLILLMFLAACGKKTTETMYLAPAELTKEEQGILDLLEVTPDQFLIYDFSLEDGIEKLEVNLYELEDGSWKPLVSGGQPFEDTQGRIALGFTKLTQGLKVGVQSEHQNGATAYTRNPEEDEESSGCATVKLSEKKQVAWDEEIPLVVQVMTAKNEIYTYSPDAYFHPEDYAKHGYDHVFAITVRFSQTPLSSE